MSTGNLIRMRRATILMVTLVIVLGSTSLTLAGNAQQKETPSGPPILPTVNSTWAQVNPYYRAQIITLVDGRPVVEARISGPAEPPPGFEHERTPVASSALNLAGVSASLTVPAYDWVFGCSAVSASMIGAYFDRNGLPDIYGGPTNSGVMPMDNSVWGTWTDGYKTYPSNPLTASRSGLDGRTAKGSINDYWVSYGSTASDPFITGGWTQHPWSDAFGDYMKTSQSAYGNTDGSTAFYFFTNGSKLTCADMESSGIAGRDGTFGRKLFYEARGYSVADCYSQLTDNQGATYGFTFANYKAQIDAGKPVLLNLQGHSVVGVGYADPNMVYLHDTWDYDTHEMTWGSSYAGMALHSVSIVNPAVSTPPPSPTASPTRTATYTPSLGATYTPTPTATAKPESQIMVAPQAGARPIVDGNLSEWASLSPTLLDKTTAHTIGGSAKDPTLADLSAGLRAAWAPEALYFAANITDDVLVGNNSAQIWGDDVLELAIRVPQTGQTHQFTLAVDGRITDNNFTISSLTYVTRTVPGGWALEVTLPPAALGLNAFAANHQYPFNFALWDDDLRTYPGQTHLIWQSDTVSVYKSDWGVLKLSSAVYDFPQAGTPTPTATVNPAAPVVTARRAGNRPTLDGNVTEWTALGQALLSKITAGSISGSVKDPTLADLSAGLRGAWAPDALYFAANITDDVLVGNNSTQIWGDDVLELAIRVPQTGQTHQFTLAVDGRTTDNGSAITSLTYVTRTVPGGWTLEVAIPPSALGLVALAANEQYPFTFGLWDDDLRTYPGQTHMIWQGTSTNTYQPAWGALKLSSTLFDFPQPAATPTPTPTVTPTATPSATHTPTPTATATATGSATPSVTPTSIAPDSDIAGTVWLDADGDALPDADEFGLSGVTVKLLRDGIQVGQTTTAGDGTYRFSALPAGTYLVRELQPAWVHFSTTPDEVPVVLAASETRTVNFGDWDGRALYLPLVLR